MDRSRQSGLRFAFALIAAVTVAEAAVMLLRPRDGVITPDPVEVRSYFSNADLSRARDYRDGQFALYGFALLAQGGLLALLVRRPPRSVIERLPGAPALAAAAGGVALTAALNAVALPMTAISRQRSIDIGLTTRSWPGWASDVALSTAISAAFAAAGAALAITLIRRSPRRWWLAGAGVIVVVATGYTYAGPAVIDPLFNRFERLPDGAIRDDVMHLARTAQVDVGEVMVVDASKRTTGANAYVTGLGSTKRVVLYDTLLQQFTRDEVRLVVAHELGHVHHRDVQRGLLFLLLVAPASMLAVARLTERLAPTPATGAGVAALPALALSVAIVATPVTWASNQLSRRVEARADSFALRATDAPEAFLSFERRIAISNVSDPDPSALKQFLLGTHPSTIQRLGTGEAYRRLHQ